eukprot:TRINITY_DN6906_c0_g1_i11.p5 TRINITY_DN6906_c0_g1~~TRINITY_DN6906_c0_g1_i11.p5  ORF type:complete len:127 (-),score=10.18 TRINITY_DN6906_c0_g1_i11:869-1249(-)
MIVYMLLTGKHPIYRQGDSKNGYVEKLRQPVWEFPDDFSELAKDFFLKLVRIDPLERYTEEEALEHPWITRIPGPIPLSYTERGSHQRSKQMLMNVRVVVECRHLFAVCFRRWRGGKSWPRSIRRE